MLNPLKIPDSVRGFLSRWLMSPLQGMTFGDWWRLLWDNHFRISPRYWPRAVLTTLASLNNSIKARHPRLKNKQPSTSVARPIFILGHYRSGTTYLQNLFAVDPRLAYPNYWEATHPRTFFVTKKMEAWGSHWVPQKRPYDNVELGLAVPAEDELALCNESLLSMHLAWHFPRRADHYEKYLSFETARPKENKLWVQALQAFAQRLSSKYPGRQLVFKSPCHTARIPLILQAFPDALFVNIHRHPFRVFASTRHMERHARPLFAFQAYDFKDIDEFIIRRYRKMYESYFKYLHQIPDAQFCEVSYEDLDQSPLETMEWIYQAFQLPPFSRVKSKLKNYLTSLNGYQKNHYPDLPSETKAWIQAEWDLCFRAWGYSPDKKKTSEASYETKILANTFS